MDHKRRKKKIKTSTIVKIVAAVLVVGGISDGTDVQILSALDNSSKVYSKYADSIVYSFNR